MDVLSLGSDQALFFLHDYQFELIRAKCEVIACPFFLIGTVHRFLFCNFKDGRELEIIPLCYCAWLYSSFLYYHTFWRRVAFPVVSEALINQII